LLNKPTKFQIKFLTVAEKTAKSLKVYFFGRTLYSQLVEPARRASLIV